MANFVKAPGLQFFSLPVNSPCFLLSLFLLVTTDIGKARQHKGMGWDGRTALRRLKRQLKSE